MIFLNLVIPSLSISCSSSIERKKHLKIIELIPIMCFDVLTFWQTIYGGFFSGVNSSICLCIDISTQIKRNDICVNGFSPI